MVKPMTIIKDEFIGVLEYILGFLIVFLLPIQGALIATGALIIIDTITGAWKAYKLGGRSEVKSKKMVAVVPKMILYVTGIITAKIAQDYLSPAIPWVDVTTGIISIVEVKSIFENIKEITGLDLWKDVRERIGRKPNPEEKDNG